jgi:hypothetical protein
VLSLGGLALYALVQLDESSFLVYIVSGRPVYVQRNGLAVWLK